MSYSLLKASRPASLALAIAFVLNGGAQAATDPLSSQASLSLSGLSFQLIDLDPNDGIAPSLSFVSNGLIDTQSFAYDESNDTFLPAGPSYADSILPTAPLNYVTQDGLSSVNSTANGVTLKSQLPLSQLTAQGYTEGYFAGDLFTQTDLVAGDAFTLSAGTGLIVRGTLTGQSSFDVSSAAAEFGAQGYDTWSAYGYAGAAGSFFMAASVKDLYDSNGDYVGFSVEQGNRIDLDVGRYVSFMNGDENLLISDSQAQDFEFTLANFGSSDMNGIFALNMNVSSSLSLDASSLYTPPIPETLPVTPVPEPSTYALMGLGLVGIAVVARRRRHHA